MAKGPVLFALALAASGAGWALGVLPAAREAETLAEDFEGFDVDARRAAALADPGPPEPLARRLRDSLPALRSPAGRPVPAGLRERERGRYEGRVRWDGIQELFSWASSLEGRVRKLEIQALEGDAESADCRVELLPEASR